MPTRAGTLLLGAAAATALPAWLLGRVELYVLAAAAAVAVVGAMVWTAVVGRTPLGVHRAVEPARVAVGETARVELAIVGTGPRPSPVVTLVDLVDGRAGARLRVAPVAPGGTQHAAYRLPTRRRGEIVLGPLRAEVTDPLGLARRGSIAAGAARVVVLPAVDRVVADPAGRRLPSEPAARAPIGRAGEEFRSLRPYVVGDDIRRVHWPTTARVGDLVVREDEEPFRARTTVILDVEESRASRERFEAMVSAAASVVAAHRRQGDGVRLVTSAGRGTGWVSGGAAMDDLMEGLALVQQAEGTDLVSTFAVESGSDPVVVVAGDLGDDLLGPLAAIAVTAARRAARTTVVSFVARPRASVPVGLRLVDVPDGGSFASAWAGRGR